MTCLMGHPIQDTLGGDLNARLMGRDLVKWSRVMREAWREGRCKAPRDQELTQSLITITSSRSSIRDKS